MDRASIRPSWSILLANGLLGLLHAFWKIIGTAWWGPLGDMNNDPYPNTYIRRQGSCCNKSGYFYSTPIPPYTYLYIRVSKRVVWVEYRLTTPSLARKRVYAAISPQKYPDVTLHFSAGQAQVLGSCKSNVREDNQECGTEDTNHFDEEKERNCLPACQTMEFIWAPLFDFARILCAYLILHMYFPCLCVLA